MIISNSVMNRFYEEDSLKLNPVRKSFSTKDNFRCDSNRVFRMAPLIPRVGRLYVAREVAGDGHRDDEGGADPDGAPEI